MRDGGNKSSPTPTAGATSVPSPTSAPFLVTGVDLVVKPKSIAGTVCGSQASFTYTTTFHIPDNRSDGTIQFNYTVNAPDP